MVQEQLEYIAVAFLDLLGHREALRGLKRMPESPQGILRAKQVMQRTACAALEMRKDVLNFQSGFSGSGLRERGAEGSEIPLCKEGLFTGQPKMTVYGLSDAIVVAVQLGAPEEEHLPIMGVHRLLSTATMVMMKYLGLGHPLRGGIELGPGAIIEGELFGPALVRAYDLENHFAEYPRVVIGEELVRYLEIASKEVTSQEESLQIGAELAMECLDYVAVDTDDRFILDFLKKGAGGLAKGEELSLAFEVMHKFVSGQCQKNLEHGQEKLRARYHRLLGYFESRREYWGGG